MKKTFLTIAIGLSSLIASAQVLEIVSMRQLTTPDEELKIAGISPAGDYLLLTDGGNTGLSRYDLQTNTMSTITDAQGAGWNVQISKDGETITYRQVNIGNDKLVKQDVVQYNLNTKRQMVLAKNQRDASQLMDATAPYAVAINENLHMVLKHNGKTIVLTPNGKEQAYNWASISPDGSKILYYVSGMGCYVCDMEGKNVKQIAQHCRAPQWYDNHTIIGMADEDDGTYVTASAIVVYTLTGQSQILIDKHMMAIYPYAVKGKVAFSTTHGDIYMLDVK